MSCDIHFIVKERRPRANLPSLYCSSHIVIFIGCCRWSSLWILFICYFIVYKNFILINLYLDSCFNEVVCCVLLANGWVLFVHWTEDHMIILFLDIFINQLETKQFYTRLIFLHLMFFLQVLLNMYNVSEIYVTKCKLQHFNELKNILL